MISRVNSYVCAVALLAAIGLTVVAVVAPPVDAAALRAVIAMVTLAIAAELFAYSVSTGARGSMIFFPYAACLLLSPSVLTLAAFGGAIALSHSLLRSAPIKTVFNAAQLVLAGSLGVLVFLSLGGTPMLRDAHRYLSGIPITAVPAIVGLIVVYLAANSLAVYGVIAIDTHRPILEKWGEGVRKTFGYDVFVSPMAYFAAWIYLMWGFAGVLLLTIPLLVIRQLYKTNHQLAQVNQDMLELMVKAIEARDPYTSGHSRRVAQYSRIIARALGLPSSEVERVATAALLHDVGKIHEIYAPILRKPEKLNPGEWAVMQTHPIKSAELVGTVSHLKDIIAPVRHHHENWDGTGYPDGLQGEAIPIGARIVLFADTIDAMTTDRPYRKALSETQVRSELVKFRGKQFDPGICDQLLASPMFGLLFAPSQRSATPEGTKPIHGQGPAAAVLR
jgi:hypothetical protein